VKVERKLNFILGEEYITKFVGIEFFFLVRGLILGSDLRLIG